MVGILRWLLGSEVKAHRLLTVLGKGEVDFESLSSGK